MHMMMQCNAKDVSEEAKNVGTRAVSRHTYIYIYAGELLGCPLFGRFES